jgi:hypothetical protein
MCKWAMHACGPGTVFVYSLPLKLSTTAAIAARRMSSARGTVSRGSLASSIFDSPVNGWIT